MEWLKNKIFGDPKAQEITSLKEKMEELYAQKRYDEALAFAIKIRDLSIENFGKEHLFYASALNDMGLIYESMGNSKPVFNLYNEALEIRRRTAGENHPDFAETLNNLGLWYKKAGMNQDAEKMLRQALDIRRTTLGTTHPLFAQSLNNLAHLYISSGQLPEAEKYAKEALEVKKESSNVSADSMINSLQLLASIFDAQGKKMETASILQKVSDIVDKKQKSPSDENYSKLVRYSQEMNLSFQRGDYDGAVVKAKKAVDFAYSTYGNKSPECATTKVNLALLYRVKKENHLLAESLFKEALDIRESIFGPNHPETGEVCFYLGTLTLAEGKIDAARVMLKRAISIRNLVKDGWNEDIARELDLLNAAIEERERIKVEKYHESGAGLSR